MNDNIPITCAGYHFADFISNIEDIPVKLPYITLDEACKSGWKLVNHKFFSPDGKAVWLCPDCVKRWKIERQSHIDNLLNTKNRLLDEYMDNDTSVSYKVYIIDVILPSLRKEFIELIPTNEDWRKWDLI